MITPRAGSVVFQNLKKRGHVIVTHAAVAAAPVGDEGAVELFLDLRDDLLRLREENRGLVDFDGRLLLHGRWSMRVSEAARNGIRCFPTRASGWVK